MTQGPGKLSSPWAFACPCVLAGLSSAYQNYLSISDGWRKSKQSTSFQFPCQGLNSPDVHFIPKKREAVIVTLSERVKKAFPGRRPRFFYRSPEPLPPSRPGP